VPNFGNWV